MWFCGESRNKMKGVVFMKKRIGCFLLSLILVLALLPTDALAAPSTDYTLTGSGADDVVAVALAQKGKSRSDFGFTSDWCAYFACWAGRKAGADFPANKGGPRSMAQWFINNNKGVFYCFREENYDSLINAGVTKRNNIVRTSRSSFSPKKGDLICYLWASDIGSYNWSHIGIVRADYTGNGLVATVEGNTGGGSGEVATFNRYYNSRVVGIIRPNYSGGETESKPATNNNMTVSADRSSLTLDLKDKPSDTVQLSWDGKITSGMKLHMEYGDREVVKGQWGTKSGNTVPVTITGIASGSTWIRFAIKNADGNELAGTTVDITVSKPSYTISFDANGGTGAPAPQTKAYQEALQIPSEEPTREGFAFEGWAVSAGGSTEYYPGDRYTEEGDATLYAVWTPAGNTRVYDLQISAPSSVGLTPEGSEEFTVQFSGYGIDSVRLMVDGAGLKAKFVDSKWRAYPGVCSVTVKIYAESEFQGGSITFCLMNKEVGVIDSSAIDIHPT